MAPTKPRDRIPASAGPRRRRRHSLDVPAEPDSGEVAPAQFAHHVVPPIEQVANLHRVVAACQGEMIDWGGGGSHSPGPPNTSTLLAIWPMWAQGCPGSLVVAVRPHVPKAKPHPCSNPWGLPVPHRQSPEAPAASEAPAWPGLVRSLRTRARRRPVSCGWGGWVVSVRDARGPGCLSRALPAAAAAAAAAAVPNTARARAHPGCAARSSGAPVPRAAAPVGPGRGL